ncbi:unnamed protein product [Ixodes pacificus]
MGYFVLSRRSKGNFGSDDVLCVGVGRAGMLLGSSRSTVRPLLGAVAVSSGTSDAFVKDTAWMRRCILACRRSTSAWSLSLAVESSSIRACCSLRVSQTDVRVSTVPSAPRRVALSSRSLWMNCFFGSLHGK